MQDSEVALNLVEDNLSGSSIHLDSSIPWGLIENSSQRSLSLNENRQKLPVDMTTFASHRARDSLIAEGEDTQIVNGRKALSKRKVNVTGLV